MRPALVLSLAFFLSLYNSGSSVSEVIVDRSIGRLEEGSCRKLKDSNDLRTRFAESDVVLSGTILDLLPQNGRRSKDHGNAKNITISGHVKVWEVMKGSLEHVPNVTESRILREQRRKRKRDLETVNRHRNRKSSERGGRDWQHFVMDQATEDERESNKPMVQVFGLQNSHLCSSFVREGDTRLFFLRKMKNFRRGKRSKRRSRRCGKKRKRSSGKKGRRCERRNLLTGSKSKRTRRNGKPKRRRRSGTKEKYLLLVHQDPARISMSNLNKMRSSSLE